MLLVEADCVHGVDVLCCGHGCCQGAATAATTTIAYCCYYYLLSIILLLLVLLLLPLLLKLIQMLIQMLLPRLPKLFTVSTTYCQYDDACRAMCHRLACRAMCHRLASTHDALTYVLRFLVQPCNLILVQLNTSAT